jgi:hypothetical protein
VIEVSKDDPAAHTNPDDQLQQEAAETKEQLPTLKGFYAGYPALSLHDGGVVYIMDRHSLDDTNVTLVAVDMRKQTLKGVADCYSPRPLGYSSIYFFLDKRSPLLLYFKKQTNIRVHTRPCLDSSSHQNTGKCMEY